MKKVVVCALAVALSWIYSQAALAGAEGKRVAVFVSSTKQPFVSALAASIEKKGAALGLKVTVLTSGYDSAIQAQQVADAIADKYDMIAILAVDGHAIIPTLVRAKAADIPVIIVNNPIEEGHEDLYLTYVGNDKPELGRIAAHAVLDAAANRPTARVAIIGGTSTDNTSRLQIEAFKAVAAQNKKLDVVDVEDARWDMAIAERQAGQLFARFASRGGLDAIFTPVDSMAVGIIQAANAANVPLGTADGQLIVVSSGCMKFGLDPLRNGQLYSTITVIPTTIGEVTANVMADYFNGKPPKASTNIPVEEVTKGNVDKYAAACTF
jgi:ribose transport system substrate-binding protein